MKIGIKYKSPPIVSLKCDELEGAKSIHRLCDSPNACVDFTRIATLYTHTHTLVTTTQRLPDSFPQTQRCPGSEKPNAENNQGTFS